MTLHFIDDEHLLLTHSARKLIPRLPDELPEEDARLLRAAVIHLPEGDVEAETEWRTYDHAQYLWQMGKGRFLLRVKGRLYLIQPLLHERGVKEARFTRSLVYSTSRQLEAVQLSPNGELLTVQTSQGRHIGDDPDEPVSKAVEIEFLQIATSPGGALQTSLLGKAQAKTTVEIPLNEQGSVSSTPDSRTQWGFDYKNFRSGSLELAGMESSCKPEGVFISESEFIAFGCRGGGERNEIGGFNLRGEALWLTTTESPVWISFALAPETERFAYRNTWLTIPMPAGQGSSDPENLRAQVVRVFRGHSGEEILRVYCSPAQRAGQNFALSPNGRKLAVVRDGAIEIYGLPPLNAEEKTALEKDSEPAARGEIPPGGAKSK